VTLPEPPVEAYVPPFGFKETYHAVGNPDRYASVTSSIEYPFLIENKTAEHRTKYTLVTHKARPGQSHCAHNFRASRPLLHSEDPTGWLDLRYY
jgi:hypothetical protein